MAGALFIEKHNTLVIASPAKSRAWQSSDKFYSGSPRPPLGGARNDEGVMFFKEPFTPSINTASYSKKIGLFFILINLLSQNSHGAPLLRIVGSSAVFPFAATVAEHFS